MESRLAGNTFAGEGKKKNKFEIRNTRKNYDMLRKIRITLAAIFFILLTLLFLDFTGTLHAWFGWMAKVQFLPAVLALNFGVVAFLIVLTLVMGRIYCSVICPLGVMQDIFGYFGKKRKKNRYSYSPAKKTLRYAVLALFIIALIAGLGQVVAILAPYSAYGRIAQNILSPIWQGGNNLLAYIAERMGSYTFYTTDIWIRSLGTLAVAALTLIILGTLAWRNGRTYCNTICPVGTVLGFLSEFSLFKPIIDTSKCNGCGLCARNCKSSCIDSKNHSIDYSRCVACMDCIDKCNRKAISYTWRPGFATRLTKKTYNPIEAATDTAGKNVTDRAVRTREGISRRSFLSVSAMLATAETIAAQQKKVDGGLAVIADKKVPKRSTYIVPAGSHSIHNMATHCTGCQLCVAVCPNGVLRPRLLTQPEMSYERGYCRPECTICSEVCPAGAIRPITAAEKSSIQIGHAVWIKENCIPLVDAVQCGNCARHCPSGAITMVPSDPAAKDSCRIPIVNIEKCIGCGACENLCPARPFSAIYVEGHQVHKTI